MQHFNRDALSFSGGFPKLPAVFYRQQISSLKSTDETLGTSPSALRNKWRLQQAGVPDFYRQTKKRNTSDCRLWPIRLARTMLPLCESNMWITCGAIEDMGPCRRRRDDKATLSAVMHHTTSFTLTIDPVRRLNWL